MRLFFLASLGCPSSDTLPADDTAVEPPIDSTLPEPVEGELLLRVDAEVPLMLHATFVDEGADEAWVEYRFEGEDWLVAPVIAPGEAVILGIPELTTVEARAVTVAAGEQTTTSVAEETTGALPPGLVRPSVNVWEPGAASPEPWLMISVASGNFTYEGPYFVEIFDRQGRVVWYTQVPEGLFSFYPSIAADGTHIWHDAEDIFGFSAGDPHVTRRTLDGRWQVTLEAPSAGQAFSEGPDGSFFYELRGSSHGVRRLDASGDTTLVWDCDAFMEGLGLSSDQCLLNACNWDVGRNTILASQFETSTVLEVDVATGEVLHQMGQLDAGDPISFVPSTSEFAYQHWPYWTAQGTLMTSTHASCSADPGACGPGYELFGQPGIQIAAEYELDEDAGTLTLVSSVVSTDRWATQVGEAYRLSNGNVLQGYGQNGAVRELTPDGETVFEATWPSDLQGYRVVGHTSLIADLYALNVGG